jgi:hypothetical protein
VHEDLACNDSTVITILSHASNTMHVPSLQYLHVPGYRWLPCTEHSVSAENNCALLTGLCGAWGVLFVGLLAKESVRILYVVSIVLQGSPKLGTATAPQDSYCPTR